MAINLTYAAKDTVLRQGLVDVLNSSVLKDVVLACSEGRCLQAHRIILSTFSPYFKQLLAVCKEPTYTILLPDVTGPTMEVLLEFMYTGAVRVNKNILGDLVKANRYLHIIGLDELLSKHVGCGLPPKKKQRIDSGSVKTSSFFRPWDSPVLAPRPEYTLPWMYSKSGLSMSHATHFPMASANYLSKTIPCPMPTERTIVSETAPSFPWAMSQFSETATLLSSPMPWSMPQLIPMFSETPLSIPHPMPQCHRVSSTDNLSKTIPVPMLSGWNSFSETVPSTPDILPRHVEKFMFKTSPSPAPVYAVPEFTIATTKETKLQKPLATTKKAKLKSCEEPKTGGKYLVPGKQRCDICNSDFYNVKVHKASAHKILKKPIECCGTQFTTKKDLKKHKKIHKY